MKKKKKKKKNEVKALSIRFSSQATCPFPPTPNCPSRKKKYNARAIRPLKATDYAPHLLFLFYRSSSLIILISRFFREENLFSPFLLLLLLLLNVWGVRINPKKSKSKSKTQPDAQFVSLRCVVPPFSRIASSSIIVIHPFIFFFFSFFLFSFFLVFRSSNFLFFVCNSQYSC